MSASSSNRVLLITGEYPPLRGGVADYTSRLRAALGSQGQRTLVLTSEGGQGEGVHTIGSWSWPVAMHIREMIKREPVDLVHIQYQAGAFDMHPAINALPTTLSAWIRLPVVTTFHDLRAPYLFPKAGRLRQAVMLRMARASAAVVVTNPGDERILQAAEIETQRIPLGPSLPKPVMSESDTPQPSIGFFGFPSREKGFADLIQAVAKFPAAVRPSVTLVGASRPDTGTHQYIGDDQVENLASDLGVTLTRTGFLPADDAANALAATRVIALPFVHGASQRSSALIAALRIGKPVVTTSLNVRDDLDQLADLPQLLLVAPGDPDALHEVLRRALESQIGADPLPDEYSWSSIASKHIDLYRSIQRRG